MSAPGRSFRKGVTLLELMDMFPDDDTATEWFESIMWPDGRCCGHCGGTRTGEVPNAKPMPYWCTDCRSYFSVRTGTAIARSKVPLQKWAIAIYLCLTSLKSVASLKLHRDIGVSQKTAWFMLHHIREAWALETSGMVDGPVEADETYFGGLSKNMHRKERKAGRARANKTEVAGVLDRKTKQVRAAVIRRRGEDPIDMTPKEFVIEHTAPDAVVYTDETPSYKKLPNREFVTHGFGEYVRGKISINGMESFWSMLKRAHNRDVPQAQPEAPEPLHSGVRRQVQHPRRRDARADAGHRRPARRTEPPLPRPDRRQRPAERGAPTGAVE